MYVFDSGPGKKIRKCYAVFFLMFCCASPLFCPIEFTVTRLVFFKNPKFWYGRGKILVKKNYTPGVKKKIEKFKFYFQKP